MPAVCVPPAAPLILAVGKGPPAVQVVPLYSSVAVDVGLTPPKANQLFEFQNLLLDFLQ
jgi:hypothetical protein